MFMWYPIAPLNPRYAMLCYAAELASVYALMTFQSYAIQSSCPTVFHQIILNSSVMVVD